MNNSSGYSKINTKEVLLLPAKNLESIMPQRSEMQGKVLQISSGLQN